MGTKQDALAEVAEIIRRNGLTIEEVAEALKGAGADPHESGGIMTRVFSYIGGIFVFAGLAVFIDWHWDDLDSVQRIMLTLGPGFCSFIMALVCLTDERFERAATPLFLIAAAMEPTGIMVMMKEYSHGGDPAYGVLFMSFVMAVQQGCAFLAKDRTVLALTTVFFIFSFFTVGLDLMRHDYDIEGVVLGLGLSCVAWALDHSRHRAIAPLCYFFGSIGFLSAAWHWMHDTPVEVLFVALSAGVIYVSTVARSRTLLLVGTLALISYIGDFTAEHFMKDHMESWPFVLIFMGFVMIGLGALAMRLNRKYIKQKA